MTTEKKQEVVKTKNEKEVESGDVQEYYEAESWQFSSCGD